MAQAYQDYAETGLTVINGMLPHYGYDLFLTTVEEAWAVFLDYVQTQPMSSLNCNYSYYGLRFQSDLSVLWPAFQNEMAHSLGLI